MERRYDSFLLRYWHWDRIEHRIEVEHVQSGQHTRVRSLADALAWIEARGAEETPARRGTIGDEPTTGGKRPRNMPRIRRQRHEPGTEPDG